MSKTHAQIPYWDRQYRWIHSWYVSSTFSHGGYISMTLGIWWLKKGITSQNLLHWEFVVSSWCYRYYFKAYIEEFLVIFKLLRIILHTFLFLRFFLCVIIYVGVNASASDFFFRKCEKLQKNINGLLWPQQWGEHSGRLIWQCVQNRLVDIMDTRVYCLYGSPMFVSWPKFRLDVQLGTRYTLHPRKEASHTRYRSWCSRINVTGNTPKGDQISTTMKSHRLYCTPEARHGSDDHS